MTIKGILFDKDGTLFAFGATWNAWAGRVLSVLSKGDPACERALARVIHFDLEQGSFLPSSPVIAGTNREVAALLCSVLRDRRLDDIENYLALSAVEAPVVPAVPLTQLLTDLAGRGLHLGVMTNDSEVSARAQLEGAGILEQFSFIAGADSGHGAKPDPAPLTAFATAHGLQPAEVVMVGDSTHDLVAGRAAGMATVAVLTGMAGPEVLSPHADQVMPDVGGLPAWLDRLS